MSNPNLIHLSPKLTSAFKFTIPGTKIIIHSISQVRKLKTTLAFSDQSSDPDKSALLKLSPTRQVLIVHLLYFRHHLNDWACDKKTRSLLLAAYIPMQLSDPQTREKPRSTVSWKSCNRYKRTQQWVICSGRKRGHALFVWGPDGGPTWLEQGALKGEWLRWRQRPLQGPSHVQQWRKGPGT